MEYTLSSIDAKFNKSKLKIIKFNKELEKIKLLRKSKMSHATRMKIFASSKTSQIVIVTNTIKGTVTKYLSARRAAEALSASNSTIMNKLNGKNTKLYKGIYLIEEIK